MNQKDIDRLLAGRKAIDEIKRPDVDVVNTLNLTTKKSETVSLTVVKQSLSELDALRKIESDSIIAAEKQLIELGFKGIGNFLEFNRQMCLEETKDRLEIKRLPCEGCPTKKCIELYKDKACFYDTSGKVPEYMAQFILSLRLKSNNKDWSDVRICPKGFGIDWTVKREPQFDLRWRYNG
jgi:hypothetical protein